MKQILLILALFSAVLPGCKTGKPVAEKHASETAVITGTDTLSAVSDPQSFDYHQQASWLLGYFNPEFLRREPHSEWFLKGYDEYVPESQFINVLLDIPQDNLNLKIVMGTWCPDSRREVPRFMRILDLWHFPADKVTFIGVDEDKVSPVGEYEKLNIGRVPTFIIYKNNIEAGRIIETPVTSLEQDMVKILTGMK